MITCLDKEYELFFSNNLNLLNALNYSDELFFNEFEELVGARYRILSIIKKGWQEKYILSEDLDKLKIIFEKKKSDENWIDSIYSEYIIKSKEFKDFLKNLNYNKLELKLIREKSAKFDAMSNMLHLFSSLIGYQFFKNLNNYSSDKNNININFIHFTQPINKSISPSIELSNEDKIFSKILRIGAFIKDDVSKLLELRNIEIKKIIDETLFNLQIKEIIDSDYSKISARDELTVIFYEDKKMSIFEGDKAKEFLQKGSFKEEFKKYNENKIFAQTASLGCAIGKAFVVNNSIEAKEIKEGDILVAPYTAVEYLLAMKKASGIITETSGITSHAAIISRELKIPCLVGLEDATKNIKTGDDLYLDANEGYVKIISK